MAPSCGIESMLSPRRLVLLQTLHSDRVMHNSFRGSYVSRANDRTAAETGCEDPNSTGSKCCLVDVCSNGSGNDR